MKNVTLLAPHTHDGKQYSVGDTITVSQQDYDFLLARGIIELSTIEQDK